MVWESVGEVADGDGGSAALVNVSGHFGERRG